MSERKVNDMLGWIEKIKSEQIEPLPSSIQGII